MNVNTLNDTAPSGRIDVDTQELNKGTVVVRTRTCKAFT
jgi:hypothetical protein